MAVFHPYEVRCSCGNVLQLALAEAVNVERMPDARERILKGELHRAHCPACGRDFTVEKAFTYADFPRRAFFRVRPRQERHLWQETSEQLERDVGLIPASLLPGARRMLRVVFGMAELREKLVAQDARLDDRKVELLKVLVAHDHPFLFQRPRLRLHLTAVLDGDYEFTASYDHRDVAYRLRLPRQVADPLIGEPELMERWVRKAHRRAPLFDLERDHWVNMWRWSPQTSALAYLKALARDIRAGKVKKLPMAASAFKNMLEYLPRGKNLPAWAKRDLQTVFTLAKKQKLGKLQDTLFEIRFGITLDDDWALNDDPTDIDTLWKLLKNLPDSNVEGNVKIDELKLEPGEGGGWYEPWSHDIYIETGALGRREWFEDVVRHEVGHAVHEMYKARVDPMLESQFGWRRFPATEAGVDDWVQLIGGWGALTSQERADVRGFLLTALGPGEKWTPGPAPHAPLGHPWNGPDFGPRLAYEQTGAHWFRNFQNWYQAGGRAFFLNYWYRELMAVGTKTLALVARMPSNYAAMSPFEFFAELYALYYDLDDPKRGIIPAAVVTWLGQNIGVPDANAPARPDLHPAHRSGGARIRRPGLPRPVGRGRR